MNRLSVIQDLQKTIVSYEYMGAGSSQRIKTEDELSKQLELLNQEVSWIDEVGSMQSFLDSIMRFEEEFSYQEGIDKKKVLQIVMNELKDTSKAVLEKTDLWEYCNEENLEIVIDLQNETHRSYLSIHSNTEFLIAAQKALKYFESTEEFEKCIFIQRIVTLTS